MSKGKELMFAMVPLIWLVIAGVFAGIIGAAASEFVMEVVRRVM
jgi:hypothetical protein